MVKLKSLEDFPNDVLEELTQMAGINREALEFDMEHHIVCYELSECFQFIGHIYSTNTDIYGIKLKSGILITKEYPYYEVFDFALEQPNELYFSLLQEAIKESVNVNNVIEDLKTKLNEC